MRAKNNRINLLLILIPLLLIMSQFLPCVADADDHKRRGRGDKQYENRDHTGRRIEKENDGNEITGQTAAWLLVAANFTVVLSILMKGLIRHYSFELKTISSIKRFDQLQKRHLMRFHNVLNPVALPGRPTCMVFAVQMPDGGRDGGHCPELSDNNRQKLSEYLTGFDLE